MKGWTRVLFWCVLSAAFVGPGTVTVCARAGAEFGASLVWALLFSVTACFVLQEMAARITLVTGQSLGEALSSRWEHPIVRNGLITLVCGAVLLGAAAYQAGNLIGAREGLKLLQLEFSLLPLLIPAVVAFCVLWFAPAGYAAKVLGVVVALMGISFLITAGPKLDYGELLRGLVPSLPEGSTWTAIALVGTTVVPYNLFLGSSLAVEDRLQGFRIPLAVAIGLGGVVSLAILVVGMGSPLPFSFTSLGETLSENLGPWAKGGFAVGLFAAGLSSALTAPLAAALTAKALFHPRKSNEQNGGPRNADPRWQHDGIAYRAVWITILLAGTLFAAFSFKPTLAITAAQAFNGMILPIVAGFLWLVAADAKKMGAAANGFWGNCCAAAVLIITTALGSIGIYRAIHSML